ncbi:MAG: peptide deformylase [Candidatus Dojkabacteria bacterium]
MVKDIVQIGNPILTQKTKKVTDINAAEVKSLISDLLDTCKANERDTAGLAAPQIDSNLRICVVRRVDLEDDTGRGKIADDELWTVMINPVIVERSAQQSLIWEACLSIGKGDDQLWGPVDRPEIATAEFTAPNGKTKTLTGDGFFSHLIQHEIDHLDGILFLKYIKNPKNIRKSADLDKYVEKHKERTQIL